MFGYAATAARRNRSQAAAAVSVTLATVAASAWLIRGDSLAGAAAASVVSAAAGLLAFGAVFLTTGTRAAGQGPSPTYRSAGLETCSTTLCGPTEAQ
jgi:hypothetical protein